MATSKLLYLQNWKIPMLNSVPHSAASGWSGLQGSLGCGSSCWACIGPELGLRGRGGPHKSRDAGEGRRDGSLFIQTFPQEQNHPSTSISTQTPLASRSPRDWPLDHCCAGSAWRYCRTGQGPGTNSSSVVCPVWQGWESKGRNYC